MLSAIDGRAPDEISVLLVQYSILRKALAQIATVASTEDQECLKGLALAGLIEADAASARFGEFMQTGIAAPASLCLQGAS